MSELAWLGFIAASGLAFVFFFFTKRRFDLLTVAYIGTLFYFSPLFVGRVLAPHGYDPTIPAPVYLIATSYMLALIVFGSIASHIPAPTQVKWAFPPTAPCYLALSAIGLIVAIAATNGAIFNSDKVVALRNVGYGYTLFEIGASLACIAGVVERRWFVAAAGCLLLAVDLLIGFRVYTVLTAISVGFVFLARQPDIQLFRKAPTYGAATVLLVAAMLLVHTARFAIFDRAAVLQNTARTVSTAQMRSDTLQFIEAAPAEQSSEFNLPGWAKIPLRLFEQSEPFIVQSTLTETVRQSYSCSATNILKSATLIPGASRLLPAYPMTFYDEFQPVLFPTVTYGMGGNIWAEMLCRFSYAGLAVFGLAMIAALVGMQRLFLFSPSALAAPLAFSGVIIAFYIHRNDLHYTLVMLRQTWLVAVAALCISFLISRGLRVLLLNFNRAA